MFKIYKNFLMTWTEEKHNIKLTTVTSIQQHLLILLLKEEWIISEWNISDSIGEFRSSIVILLLL